MTGARLIASAGGLGFLPRAPGTWGSAAALALGAGLLAAGGPTLLAAATVGAVGAGLWAIPRAGGSDDPGWVVIDEVAGMWLGMLPLQGAGPLGFAAAFALFRVLDIAKPGPIGALDRIPGRFGIMGDDLAAGLLAALVLAAADRLLPTLGHL